jgi:hypothetical protein
MPVRISPVNPSATGCHISAPPHNTHTSLLDRNRHYQRYFLPASIHGSSPDAFGSTNYPSRKYTSVYRIYSFISLLLQVKSTAVALLDNDDGAYPSNHPHSQYLARLRLPYEHERSKLTRSRLSFTRVLMSLDDHPIVAIVGYDVLLATLSLCSWAVLRGMSVNQILYAAGHHSRQAHVGGG